MRQSHEFSVDAKIFGLVNPRWMRYCCLWSASNIGPQAGGVRLRSSVTPCLAGADGGFVHDAPCHRIRGPSAVPTTLKCCEAGSRVSPPYPVSPFSATFCRRTEASGGSGPYMGIFRIIIRSKIGVSKNYENYSFYSPRFLSPYMGLFLSQRWSLFIIVRSLFARVIKIAHCSFFRTFAHGIIRFGRLSAGY